MLTKLLPPVFGVLCTISLSLSSWTLAEIVHLRTEAARAFTVDDGAQVWKEIATIKEQVAAIPHQSPPTWFIDEVNKMEQRLDKRIDTLEAKLDRLNNSKR